MMMMENTNNLSSYFPITFFDGERELDMGTVQITPSLTFKQFQSILSNLLHISPHQITIYFQRHNINNNDEFHHSNHHRRRHPVTSKFDFDSILNESSHSSFFWVVQKRSRRTRRRKPKSLNFNDDNNNNNNNNGGFVLLRRNDLEYANRMTMMMEVERERERYLMSMNLNSNVYDDLSYLLCNNNNGGFGRRREGYNGNFSDDGASSSGGTGSSFNGYCDVCYNNAVRGGGGETVPFHWCKNDAVTKVFRSPAGPIAPPKKMNDFQFFG